MNLVDRVRELKAQQMKALDALHTAKIDSRTLTMLPKSPEREKELGEKRAEIARLEIEAGQLGQLISAMTPPGAWRL